MEPPAGGDPATPQQLKWRCSSACRKPIRLAYVRGQLRDTPASMGSLRTPPPKTFDRLRLEHRPDWTLVRSSVPDPAGKRLPVTQTEVRLVFQDPPRLGFGLWGDRDAEPDQIVIRLDPATGLRFRLDSDGGPAQHASGGDHVGHDVRRGGWRGTAPRHAGVAARCTGRPGRPVYHRMVWKKPGRSCSRCSTAAPSCAVIAAGSWGPASAEGLADDSAAGTTHGCRRDVST